MRGCTCPKMFGQQAIELHTSGHMSDDTTRTLLQVIVDDYVQSEAVLKASRMHHELDLDGVPSSGADRPALHSTGCHCVLCCIAAVMLDLNRQHAGAFFCIQVQLHSAV